VPAVIAEPSEVLAVVTRESVLALITAASDAVATPTLVSVFELTALVIPAVALLVFALITVANDVLAVLTVVVTPDTSD
jgi:hypothetical protein